MKKIYYRDSQNVLCYQRHLGLQSTSKQALFNTRDGIQRISVG